MVALLPATGGAADAGGRHYDDVGSETASEVAVQNRAHAVSRTSQLRKSSSTVSQLPRLRSVVSPHTVLAFTPPLGIRLAARKSESSPRNHFFQQLSEIEVVNNFRY